MKTKITALAAMAFAIILSSCSKEEIVDPMYDSDAASVTVNAVIANGEDPDDNGKATISDNGFRWNPGDVLTWTDDKGNTASCTLNAQSISADGKQAAFTASIPGLASGDVRGFFSCNCAGDVNFTGDGLNGSVLSLSQSVAGTINPDFMFMHGGMGYTTLTKGSTSVEISMNLAGTVIAARPFTAKYNSEKVTAVRFVSDSEFCGACVYDHAKGTATVSGDKADKYYVTLGTPMSLSKATGKDNASSVFFAVPACTIPGYRVIVITDAAKYTFTSTSGRTFGENHFVKLPLNLDKAERSALPTPKAISLTESMVKTNGAMEYKTYGKNPDDCGFATDSQWADWFLDITEAQANARRLKYDVKSNMWDGNAATCYHTNLDWGQSGTSWGCRFKGPFYQDYIQITLNAGVECFNIEIQNNDKEECIGDEGLDILLSNDGSSFKKVGNYACSGHGTRTVIKGISNGNSVTAIRFMRNIPVSGSWWTSIESSFGIAEIKIWDAGITDEGGDTPQTVDVTGITLSPTTLSLAKGASSTLTAHVTPDNATNKTILWSSNSANATVDKNGKVTAVSKGTAIITAKSEDGNFSKTCTVTVTEGSASPIAVSLNASMISTNDPMQYVTGSDGADSYGFKTNPDWFLPINGNERTARESKYGLVNNMWDGNAATCYHTNLDWGIVSSSWGNRTDLPDRYLPRYIQINLGATVSAFRLKLQNSDSGHLADGYQIQVSENGTSFTNAGNAIEAGNFGDSHTVDITATGKYIRITNTRSDADWTCVESAFGIAELQLWTLDGTNPGGGSDTPSGGIRTIDNAKTTYFLPRRWKSGMNVSTNSWYKYWSDPTGIWNSSSEYLWLPNCTHYAMGRSAEISQRPVFSNHELFNSGYPNAQNWYANSKWSKATSGPKLGAICVWGGGQYGHVAVVEKINSDGTVDISQSSYSETDRSFNGSKYFNYWDHISNVAGRVTSKVGWTFIGYIYNPYVVDLRVSRNTNCSQVYVFVDALVVRNDAMVQTGLSVLSDAYYNVYAEKTYEGRTWVKIADNAWIPLQSDWNTMYY